MVLERPHIHIVFGPIGVPIIDLNNGVEATYNNCLVANINNPGIISSSDPLFVQNGDPSSAPNLLGDFHLQNSSPAINIGNNGFNSEMFDLDGNPRILNLIIEIKMFK